jgi:hypothetical protein
LPNLRHRPNFFHCPELDMQIHALTKESLAVALMAMASISAHATTVVDTGTPNGIAVGAYALDASNFVAGQVSFAQGVEINAIRTHVLGGSVGDTFSLRVYTDGATHLPGSLLYVAQATLGAEGWNGLTGLSGWALTAGTYWVGVEVRALDNVSTGLLDRGAPLPLQRSAFDDGSGYVATAAPISFGLRIDATVAAVPEPAEWMFMVVGLLGLLALARARR